jgi:hypothetical protein
VRRAREHLLGQPVRSGLRDDGMRVRARVRHGDGALRRVQQRLGVRRARVDLRERPVCAGLHRRGMRAAQRELQHDLRKVRGVPFGFGVWAAVDDLRRGGLRAGLLVERLR